MRKEKSEIQGSAKEGKKGRHGASLSAQTFSSIFSSRRKWRKEADENEDG